MSITVLTRDDLDQVQSDIQGKVSVYRIDGIRQVGDPPAGPSVTVDNSGGANQDQIVTRDGSGLIIETVSPAPGDFAVMEDVSNPAQSFVLIYEAASGQRISNASRWAFTGVGSLTITPDGMMGLGTESPERKIHIFSSQSIDAADHASVMLEHTVPGQKWDLRNNRVTGVFEVSDATGGGNPLKVQPGSPTNALVVSSAGVGLGVASPVASLHVAGTVVVNQSSAPTAATPGTDGQVILSGDSLYSYSSGTWYRHQGIPVV